MVTQHPTTKSVGATADAALVTPPEDALSRESLLHLFDHDDSLLQELLELFLAEGPTLLRDIQGGISALDPALVERAAHTLKGSVGNFGAKRAFEFSRRIEAMGRDRDLGGAPEALRALELEMTRITSLMATIAGKGLR